MSDNDRKLIITFKKSELDMLKKFKEKYSSPASIIKDFIKKDVYKNTPKKEI